MSRIYPDIFRKNRAIYDIIQWVLFYGDKLVHNDEGLMDHRPGWSSWGTVLLGGTEAVGPQQDVLQFVKGADSVHQRCRQLGHGPVEFRDEPHDAVWDKSWVDIPELCLRRAGLVISETHQACEIKVRPASAGQRGGGQHMCLILWATSWAAQTTVIAAAAAESRGSDIACLEF